MLRFIKEIRPDQDRQEADVRQFDALLQSTASRADF